MELAAEPLSVANVMRHQLLETRKGQSQDKTGFPPSLVSVSWLRQSEDLESGSKAGVVSLELGRPVKLSFSLSFLSEVLRMLVQLKKTAKLFLFKQQIEEDLNDISEHQSSSEFATPQTTPQTSEDLLPEEQNSEGEMKLTEVTVTTNQVLVELALTSSNDTDIESESTTGSSMAAQEVDVSLQGETLSPCSKSHTKEGLMLAWKSLTLSIPPADKLTQTSELSIDDLQLLSIIEELGTDIVSPIHLNCLITHHKPCSRHDLLVKS